MEDGEDAMGVFSAGHNQNLLELTLFSSLLLSASLTISNVSMHRLRIFTR